MLKRLFTRRAYRRAKSNSGAGTLKLRNTLVLLLTLIAVPTCAQDQLSKANSSSEKTHTETAEYDFKRGTNEFGFWLGMAPNATTQLGGLRDAQARGLRLALAGLRYGIVVASTKRFAFEYTLDVIPAATLLGAYVRCPDQM